MNNKISNYVVIAGSGRSGTTWIGSILDSYERSEYFYEICAFPDLDFDSPNLLRIKYPLTFWLGRRPNWIINTEQQMLKRMVGYNISTQRYQRSLQIHKFHGFKKKCPDVYLFKIVRLLSFSLRTEDLLQRFHGNMKVVHIIRNPFAHVISEIRRQTSHDLRLMFAEHFKKSVEFVANDPRLSVYHDMAIQYLNGNCMEHIALLWRISNELVIKDNNLPTHTVVYEDLCRNTDEEVRKIFDFLNWNMSDQTHKHLRETTNISKSAPGYYSIHKNAEESMNRWRKEIREEDYERVRKVLQGSPLLQLWSKEDLLFR